MNWFAFLGVLSWIACGVVVSLGIIRATRAARADLAASWSVLRNPSPRPVDPMRSFDPMGLHGQHPDRVTRALELIAAEIAAMEVDRAANLRRLALLTRARLDLLTAAEEARTPGRPSAGARWDAAIAARNSKGES